MNIIQICDVVAAGSIILALYMVGRNCKWWLFYSATNVFFTIITAYKGLPGMAIMGVVLGIIGVRNYFIGKKKEKK